MRPTPFSAGKSGTLHLSGRYNRTTIDNRDRITAGGGTGSLTGNNSFGRFNPAVGVTFNPTPRLNAYFSYSEGSRAPTSIELGCADPDSALQAAQRAGRRSAAQSRWSPEPSRPACAADRKAV